MDAHYIREPAGDQVDHFLPGGLRVDFQKALACCQPDEPVVVNEYLVKGLKGIQFLKHSWFWGLYIPYKQVVIAGQYHLPLIQKIKS